MTLDVWMRQQKITANAFAPRLGVSPTTVRRWITRQTRPSNKVIDRIFLVTGGAVTASDVMHQQVSSGASPLGASIEHKAAA